MFEIRPLSELTADMLNSIITGYTSPEKYMVARTEADAQTTFALNRVRLETPYVKHFDSVDEETLARYKGFLQHGLSLGVYDGDDLVALAIAEAQQWNSSLWIWEFHVAERYRGRGLGRTLMEAVAERGRAAHLRAIFCETQTTNVPAIHFYRRAGFTLDGLNLSFYTNDDWPDGEMAVFMKRSLT